MKKTTGEKIRLLRRSKNITQYKLAGDAGIHAITLVRIENNQVTPNESTLRCIANALNVTVEEIQK